MATKKAHVLRDFRDAGTETRFTKGDTVELEEGVFRNFEKAGLVSAEAPATKPKPAEDGPKAA